MSSLNNNNNKLNFTISVSKNNVKYSPLNCEQQSNLLQFIEDKDLYLEHLFLIIGKEKFEEFMKEVIKTYISFK